MRYRNIKEGTVEIWDAIWFAPGGVTIGIVLGYDPVTDLYHGYIGDAFGEDENNDAKKIVAWGSRLNRQQTVSFFPRVREIQETKDEQWKL